MRLPVVSDWRLFGALVIVTTLLILSELSIFSSATAGFTSEAMAQSLFAYGRRPDGLEITISVLFSLSLIAAGLMLAYRRPLFAFAFLTIIFLHNGLSFYASSVVTQPMPSILATSSSFGFLLFGGLSIVFFELALNMKNQIPSDSEFESSGSKTESRSNTGRGLRFTRLDFSHLLLEILVASTIVGLIAAIVSGPSSSQVASSGALLNVGTNVGGGLRLAAGLFGAFALILIFLRFLLPTITRLFVSRKLNVHPQVDKLEKIRRQVLRKYIANLFSLQNELKYFVRRTPVLIIIPKRRDVTLIMLPLLALAVAYVTIGVMFSLGIFADQVESLRIGYQNSIIPFDSSLYDLEQNSSVSDNVFSVGAEVAGAAVNDFLIEIANAVDEFFRSTVR